MTIREIARLIGAAVEGDGDREIFRVAKIDVAGDGDMTFLANPKYARFLAGTQAAAVIVGRKTAVEGRPDGAPPLSLLRVDDPYVAFVRVLALFHPPFPRSPKGFIRPPLLHRQPCWDRTSVWAPVRSSANGAGSATAR